jgi:threonine dehydrogenase-like Zn-dependent dehydrogenase
MECRDVPTPSAEPGTLLLKTRSSLICGSDLEYLDGIHGDIEPGMIRGHEFVAEVAEVGEGVSGWEVGDRAVPISYTPNYGCWADYFVTPPVGVQKVPEHVPDEEAVFVEPLHTGFGAVEAAGLKPGRSVAIIGVGKIGLLAVMSAKVVGAAPIFAIDIAQSRLDKALEVGAHTVYNAKEDNVVSRIKARTKGNPKYPSTDGPDVVIVCARQGEVLDQALDIVKQGGKVILAGFVPPAEFDSSTLLMKQIVLSGVMAGRFGQHRKNGEIALHMLAHKQLDPTPLLSGTMAFDDIQKAIDSTYSGENLAVQLKP